MKERYNLLFAIHDLNLDRAFDEYKKEKKLSPTISENRKARAFLAHYSHVIDYRKSCYIKGQERPDDEEHMDELIDVIQFPIFN